MIARRSNTSMSTVTCCLAGTYCPDLPIAEAFRSWESGLTQLAFFLSELRLAIASCEHPTGMSSSWMILFMASLNLCHRSRTEGIVHEDGQPHQMMRGKLAAWCS